MKLNNKMIFVLGCLFFLNGCARSQKKIEEKALFFFFSEVVDKYQYFDYSNFVLEDSLLSLSEWKGSLVPCGSVDDEGEDKLVFLPENLFQTIEKSAMVNERLSNIVLPESKGEECISISVSRNGIIENNEYLVGVRCIKMDAKKRMYRLNFFLFLDSNQNVVRWCMNPFVDQGFTVAISCQ